MRSAEDFYRLGFAASLQCKEVGMKCRVKPMFASSIASALSCAILSCTHIITRSIILLFQGRKEQRILLAPLHRREGEPLVKFIALGNK